jgi:hypothetical protein
MSTGVAVVESDTHERTAAPVAQAEIAEVWWSPTGAK